MKSKGVEVEVEPKTCKKLIEQQEHENKKYYNERLV